MRRVVWLSNRSSGSLSAREKTSSSGGPAELDPGEADGGLIRSLAHPATLSPTEALSLLMVCLT